MFSMLPQNTEVVYSGELREGRLSVFQYETELYSNAYALEDSEEGLQGWSCVRDGCPAAGYGGE